MSRVRTGTTSIIDGRHTPRRSRIETVVTDAEKQRAFPAKYPGVCPLCYHHITKGDLIFFRAGRKPLHVQCPEPNTRPRSNATG